jgi:outer membrane protein assembly factor BamB
MWGKGPDGRYKDRVCVVGVDGGACSPVVAGGMVYVFYFRPSGELKDEQQLRVQAAKVSDSPIAQQAYLDWHRTRADDVVVAMDGATGKIVWKSILNGRSFNHQTHKWRGYNPAPRVFEGVVYVGDYGGRVYALDAKTGKLLWEYSSGASAFGAGATGPVVADGVLVASAGGTVGLDRASGKQLWKGPAGNLLVWRKGDVERVLVSGGGEKGKTIISCLDAKTGKAIWTAESPFWGLGDVYPIVDGNYLVGYDVTKGGKAGEADFGKDTQVLCYRLGEQGMEKAWAVTAPYPAIDKLALTIANGHVYIDGAAETFCLKLFSGEKVATAKAGGARTQVMFAVDGRVFIQPEGRHGGQSFFMLEADPKDFRVVPAGNAARETRHAGEGQWVPLHTPDTAYANQPVIYPVVDGRLFVRGHDGLYCYDLRKTAGMPAVPAVKPAARP